MHTKHWTLLSLCLVASAASAYAAGCRTNGCNVDPDCNSSNPTGGAGGAGGSGMTDPSCIPKENQEKNGTAVEDKCGIFVRTAGDDMTGEGTKGKPYKSIGKAIEVATDPAKTRVPIYLCAEIFEESISIPSGVEIYGGLNCAGGAWAYSGKKATIAPTPDKIPVTFVKTTQDAIHLEDITMRAADASVPGGSSIAATAQDVTLELLRCDLVAGDAQPGEAGTTPSGVVQPTDPNDMQIAGVQGITACMGGAAGNVGPDGKMNPSCAPSVGGKGGTGQENTGGNGGDGLPLPAPNPMNFGVGGVGAMAQGCTAGQKGNSGDPGMPGESAQAATDVGMFDLGGYIGVNGKSGAAGMPGQGGGGGGAAKGKVGCYGASGGSGGTGGCGGKGGSGGTAGGSSIALISLGATLIFQEVTLKAGFGGNGGDGGDGQLGGVGGVGGKGGLPGGGGASGCSGGDGGDGGAGGKGGGGHGGHSLGIVWQLVPPPELPPGTITFSIPGSGGSGGDQIKAADGLAQEQYNPVSP